MNTNETPTPESGESRTMSGQKILVACHTGNQLIAYCRSHNINIGDVVRIRRDDHARGWRDRTIILLPDWWMGTEHGLIPRLEQCGWKTVEVSEQEVIHGPTDHPAPAQSEIPTPRTDAAFDGIYQPPWRVGLGNLVKLLRFARTLERELAEAREQRDRLADSLKVIQTVATPPHHERALISIRDMAINALAAVKGGQQ